MFGWSGVVPVMYHTLFLFTTISPSSPSLSTPSHAVSSSACLTCLLLRLDRAVQESEADSQSEEDEMKRRKESGGLPTTKLSCLDPSLCLRSLTCPTPCCCLWSPAWLSWWEAFLVLTFRMSERWNAMSELLVEIAVCHLYVILLKHRTFH